MRLALARGRRGNDFWRLHRDRPGQRAGLLPGAVFDDDFDQVFGCERSQVGGSFVGAFEVARADAVEPDHGAAAAARRGDRRVDGGEPAVVAGLGFDRHGAAGGGEELRVQGRLADPGRFVELRRRFDPDFADRAGVVVVEGVVGLDFDGVADRAVGVVGRCFQGCVIGVPFAPVEKDLLVGPVGPVDLGAGQIEFGFVDDFDADLGVAAFVGEGAGGEDRVGDRRRRRVGPWFFVCGGRAGAEQKQSQQPDCQRPQHQHRPSRSFGHPVQGSLCEEGGPLVGCLS